MFNPRKFGNSWMIIRRFSSAQQYGWRGEGVRATAWLGAPASISHIPGSHQRHLRMRSLLLSPFSHLPPNIGRRILPFIQINLWNPIV